MDNSQTTPADKFAELARSLECDEDENRWEERLKAVAKANGEVSPRGQKRPLEDP